MCLDRPASKLEQKEDFHTYKDKKRHKVAYKIMRRELKNAFQNNDIPLPLSRWTNEKKYRCILNLDSLRYNNLPKSYKTGFHLFVDKRGAQRFADRHLVRDYIVKQVYFRKVVARGYQERQAVIVCKEICVVK